MVGNPNQPCLVTDNHRVVSEPVFGGRPCLGAAQRVRGLSWLLGWLLKGGADLIGPLTA